MIIEVMVVIIGLCVCVLYHLDENAKLKFLSCQVLGMCLYSKFCLTVFKICKFQIFLKDHIMQFRAENSEFHGYSSSSMLQGFLQVTLLRHCSLQKYLMMGIVLMIYNEGNYHFPLKDVMINSSMDTQMVIQSNISKYFL